MKVFFAWFNGLRGEHFLSPADFPKEFGEIRTVQKEETKVVINNYTSGIKQLEKVKCATNV